MIICLFNVFGIEALDVYSNILLHRQKVCIKNNHNWGIPLTDLKVAIGCKVQKIWRQLGDILMVATPTTE